MEQLFALAFLSLRFSPNLWVQEEQALVPLLAPARILLDTRRASRVVPERPGWMGLLPNLSLSL